MCSVDFLNVCVCVCMCVCVSVRTWDLFIGGDPFLGNGVRHDGLTTDGGLEDGLCLCLCETAFFLGGNGSLFVSFEVFDDVGGNAAGGTATHFLLLFWWLVE